MPKSRLITTVLLAILAAFLISTTGCQGRAASAEKLFEQGKYEQVIQQYPDLEVARRAHAKMADKLLEEKKYDEILKNYADTRAAYEAKLQMADQVLAQGKYQTVLDSFPGTPAAETAREKLADSLYQAGNYDELIARFGDTPKAMEVKEKMASEAFDKAKKLRGEAKKKALEELVQKYSGTASYKEAVGMLSEIRQKEAQKKK